MNNFTIEKAIKEEGKGIFYTEGVSMLPLIKKGRDTVLVESCKPSLKKNDVVLFKRQDNTLVLHRIVKVKDSEYILRGDNQYSNEEGVTDDMIIGVAKGFYRDDSYIPFDSPYCRRYIFFRNLFYPFRKIWISFLHRTNIR